MFIITNHRHTFIHENEFQKIHLYMIYVALLKLEKRKTDRKGCVYKAKEVRPDTL
jgi:hypothetical protein